MRYSSTRKRPKLLPPGTEVHVYQVLQVARLQHPVFPAVSRKTRTRRPRYGLGRDLGDYAFTSSLLLPAVGLGLERVYCLNE